MSATVAESVLGRALALAAEGIPVFPCLADKSPACAGGFKSAARDPARIRALFADPAAVLVGVPTGAVSGFDVLDVDPRHGGDAWWHAEGRDNAVTRIHGTRSGGLHVFFRHADGLRSSAGKIAPGIDVRADGGYVIWWPAAGCSVPLDWETAYLPDWPAPILAAARRGDATRTAEPGKPASGFEPPPSESAVVDLLNSLPNPIEADRRRYTSVMTAAVACIRALGGDPSDSYSPIAEAAIAWAERYEGWDGTDERAKWENDWCIRDRDLAGWQSLRMAAAGLNPEYRHVIAAAEFGALPPDEPERPSRARRTMRERFVFPRDCETTRRGYVIKHLIAPGDVGCIIGQPSAGKSVLAPHLAYAVAQGRPVFGLRTKPGRVLYVAAEDFTGMRQRIQALRLQHGDAPDLAMVDCTNLRDPAEAADLRAAVRDWKPALVIIDTLGAAFAGMDENSAQDMGEVVALARQIAATGCAVLLIHRVAKQGDGTPRGHSVLNGTLDVSLRLERGDGGIVRGRLGKNRNGTDDRDIAFRIGAAMLGMDEDGEPITAPVARELTGQPQAAVTAARLSPSERLALDVLTTMRPGADGVAEDDWRAACEERRLSTAPDPKNRRKVVAKLIAGLLQKGRIAIDGGTVRLAGTAPEFGPDGALAELVE